MLAWFRQAVRNLTSKAWLLIGGALVLLLFLVGLSREGSGVPIEIATLTIGAASARLNADAPTISARLTQTPPESALTQAAPTFALLGQQEVQQFAASARASSELSQLDWGAVQVNGPPNTPECGDFRTAWASAQPNEIASITVFFPELVKPTGLLIYETYNPGFIVRITFTDVYGEVYTLYEAPPQPRPSCPFTLALAVSDADYKGNTVTIFVDQTTSTGGWNQIDAVQLIGTK
jgi:hypothetical protein